MEIKLIDSKIERLVHSLEKPIIAKVLRTIDLLETFGNRLGLPHSKNLYYTQAIMKKYTQFKRELLQNVTVKKAYEELAPEYGIIKLLINERLRKRLTQRQLAKRIGTKQSAISRLESGEYNPSLGFLYKVADALDAKLNISIGVR